MIKRIMVTILTVAFTSLQCELIPQKSTTGSSIPYREICIRAALEDDTFNHFRSIEAYFNAVECGQAGEFAAYLRKNASPKTLSLIPKFRHLDSYGNPVKNMIQGLGLFSGTTLRYILIADHIAKLFTLPKDYTAVEIGAGFGGQAYILNTLMPCSHYFIYDLPEVEMLINRMMSTLSVNHVFCLNSHAELPVDSIDLLISNYALSECDRITQLDYFNRVVAKAKRGYILFNDSNIHDHFSLDEFIQLFYANGIEPKIQPEPVFSYTGNVLITWDRTKP